MVCWVVVCMLVCGGGFDVCVGGCGMCVYGVDSVVYGGELCGDVCVCLCDVVCGVGGGGCDVDVGVGWCVVDVGGLDCELGDWILCVGVFV